MKKNVFTLYLDESGDSLIYEPEEWEKSPGLETHCTLLGTIIPHHQKDELTNSLSQIKKYILNGSCAINPLNC